jgi:hypothetical protein
MVSTVLMQLLSQAGNNLSRTCAAHPELHSSVETILTAISHPYPAIAEQAAAWVINLAAKLNGFASTAAAPAQQQEQQLVAEVEAGPASGGR